MESGQMGLFRQPRRYVLTPIEQSVNQRVVSAPSCRRGLPASGGRPVWSTGKLHEKVRLHQADASTLVRPVLGVSFQKRGPDRKDFAQGATEVYPPQEGGRRVASESAGRRADGHSLSPIRPPCLAAVLALQPTKFRF